MPRSSLQNSGARSLAKQASRDGREKKPEQIKIDLDRSAVFGSEVHPRQPGAATPRGGPKGVAAGYLAYKAPTSFACKLGINQEGLDNQVVSM